MNTRRLFGRTQIAFMIFAAISMVLLLTPVYAQQQATPTAQPSSIAFSGRVDAVDARFIVVNGLLVDITSAIVNTARLEIGINVTVFGNLQSGLIRATEIRFDDDDDDSRRTPGATPSVVIPTLTPTPGLTPMRTPTPRSTVRPRIIIEGPVRDIAPTRIRVFDVDITVDPAIINLTNIRIGDNVRVEGDFTVVNGVINIVAFNIRVITGDDRGSGRRSDRGPDRISDRGDDRSSIRSTPRPPQPPPPPPQTGRGSSGRSSRSS